MGRWPYSNRWTVEDCKSITTKFLNQYNYFNSGIRSGGIKWTRNGRENGDISFTVSTMPGDEYIRFLYTQTDRSTEEKTKLDYKARLTSTPCYFGGRRWWFICPLVVNGRICGRRVGSLHLASNKYFGCRHCYNLTYTSSKESHQFDSLFRKMGITAKQAKEMFK